MTSQKKIEANRRNAQKSTGPRTPQGKARSARNALSHGLTASSTPLLSSESQEHYDAFSQALLQDLAPRTPEQQLLAERIVQLHWRLRRLPQAEAQLFETLHQEYLDPPARDLLMEMGRPDPAAGRTPLTPAQLLAREFAHGSSNPFLRLARYERSLNSSLTQARSALRRLQQEQPQDPEEQIEANLPPEPASAPLRPPTPEKACLFASSPEPIEPTASIDSPPALLRPPAPPLACGFANPTLSPPTPPVQIKPTTASPFPVTIKQKGRFIHLTQSTDPISADLHRAIDALLTS